MCTVLHVVYEIHGICFLLQVNGYAFYVMYNVPCFVLPTVRVVGGTAHFV